MRRGQWILVLILFSIFGATFEPPEALAEAQFVLTVDVRDESGAVIPGAQVKLTKGPEDQGVTADTDHAGTVSLHLSAGSYRLSVSMNGFKSAMKEVALGDSDEQTVMIVLRVGGCPIPDPCPVVPEQEYQLEKTANERMSEVKVTVLDPTGAAVPECEVVFTSDSKQVVSHTGADGSVTVAVPSGTYAIRTTQVGFLKSETLNFKISAPSPRELRITLKLDPDFCKRNQCVCSGPTCGGAGVIVPTITPGLPSVIVSERHHPLPGQPTIEKSRSWQCLYLWKCSMR
jgi:uncharacterized membrane protein